MKNQGKVFEENWKKSMIKDNLWQMRVRDNAMSYTMTDTVFTNENPYDFLCYNFPNLFCWELKHTKYPSISIQTSANEDSNKMIKWH